MSNTSNVDNSVANPGEMGWGEEIQSPATKFAEEQKNFQMIAESDPDFVTRRETMAENAGIVKSVKDLMLADGMVGGFCARYVEKVIFGKHFDWKAQLIGSCVASGGMRLMARRALIEVFMLNDPEDIFGTSIVGINNVAPFGPYSYRAGRRLANMNSGDGSYCSVHVKGANQFGILPCSTPGLVSDDFPEPQNTTLYRNWGNSNSYMDKFVETGKLYKLLETELVKDVDQTKIVLVEQKKPLMICSMWAFRPDYQHPTWKLSDGTPVWIYKRDTSTSWAHNMSVDGFITGPDNKEYVLIENSWGMNAHKNGPYFIIPVQLYASWCNNSEQQTIGEIDLTNISPAPLP